jgi:SAM-dependent methyltransferase
MPVVQCYTQPEDLPVNDKALELLCGRHWYLLKNIPRLQYWTVPRPERCMSYGDGNLCGEQQRAFCIYWAIRECSLKGGIGLDVGCDGEISPSCIGLDKSWDEHAARATMHGLGEELKMFSTESLNAIIACHSFEHLVNPIAVLQEWNRVLKRGGVVAMILPDVRHVPRWSHDPDHKEPYEPVILRRYLEDSGCNWVLEEEDSLQNGFSFNVVVRKG